MRYCTLLFLTVVLYGQAVPVNPAPPTVPDVIARPNTTGYTVVHVHSGDDLQAIYTAASPKTDIIVDDGITYTASFTFNNQGSAGNWILVEGTGCAAGTTAIPTYVTPTNVNHNDNDLSSPPAAPPALTHYFTINASSGVSPITLTNGSSVPALYNYFGCLEITTTTTQFYLINSTNNGFETVVSQLQDHIIFDRAVVHGVAAPASMSGTLATNKGYYINGSNIVVVNSYFYDIYSGESNAVYMSTGPGPTYIHNNFLSASTEIIYAGGGFAGLGYKCNIQSSPPPTNTTATVTGCVDGNGSSVASPAIGTKVMMYFSATDPKYNPNDWVTITGNTGGSLTFTATGDIPLAGTSNVQWGTTPSDITATNNLLWKDPTWNCGDGPNSCANPTNPNWIGFNISSKNFFEAKTMVRAAFLGNVGINSWNGGQQYAFNLTSTDQNGETPWAYSSDLDIENNIFKNITGQFLIDGSQVGGGPSNGGCPAWVSRIKIQNNLFFALGAAPYMGYSGPMAAFNYVNQVSCSLAPGGPDSVQVLHNNMLGDNGLAATGYNSTIQDPRFTNVLYRDNITQFDTIPWFQRDLGCGYPCFDQLVPDGSYTFINNAIVNSGPSNMTGFSDATLLSKYGPNILSTLYDGSEAGNYAAVPFLNYSLVNTNYQYWKLNGSGPWRNAASDGTDPGVNFNTLALALFGFIPPAPPVGGITVGGPVTIK